MKRWQNKQQALTERRIYREIANAATSPTDASNVTNLSEAIDDRVNGLLVAGTNITLSYNDVANTMTISSTGGGGGNAWDFDEGSASTSYSVGTIDFEEGGA